MQGTTTLKNNI